MEIVSEYLFVCADWDFTWTCFLIEISPESLFWQRFYLTVEMKTKLHVTALPIDFSWVCLFSFLFLSLVDLRSESLASNDSTLIHEALKICWSTKLWIFADLKAILILEASQFCWFVRPQSFTDTRCLTFVDTRGLSFADTRGLSFADPWGLKSLLIQEALKFCWSMKPWKFADPGGLSFADPRGHKALLI